MVVTKQNLLQHELIGLGVKVVGSSDPTLLDVRGEIINETQNTIVVEENGEDKVVPKLTSTFLIILPSGEEVIVEGKRIIKRPEDRVKIKK